MKRLFPKSTRARLMASRLGSLVLLFQRSPIVQMLFPEAKIIGGAGIGELAKWSVATVVGLGAFDSVAGATTIAQISPNAGSNTVTAKKGQNLSFVFQLTNYPDTPGSWKVTGLPSGLTHADAKNKSVDSVSGIPTQSGNFSVKITAYAGSSYSGDNFSKTFTMNVAPNAPGLPVPEIELQQPKGTNLVDGKAKRSFGTTKVQTKGKSSTFIITNTGDANLTGLSVGKSGSHRDDFIVKAPAKTILPPGASTTFKVTFTPMGTGTRKASLRLKSNDSDENPFNITVTGQGTR